MLYLLPEDRNENIKYIEFWINKIFKRFLRRKKKRKALITYKKIKKWYKLDNLESNLQGKARITELTYDFELPDGVQTEICNKAKEKLLELVKLLCSLDKNGTQNRIDRLKKEFDIQRE